MSLVSQRASHGYSDSPSHLRSVSGRSPAASEQSETSSPPAVADSVVNNLRRYESLLREVHVAGTHLSIELRNAQTGLGLSPIAGHGVFVALDETQAQISGAIGSAARSHSRLRALAHAIGIDPTSYGERTDPEYDEEVRRSASRSGPAIAA